MTWEKIIQLEPELEKIRVSALLAKPNWQLWEDYKNLFSQYVGWKAQQVELSGQYDFVYKTILAAFEQGGKKV